MEPPTDEPEPAVSDTRRSGADRKKPEARWVEPPTDEPARTGDADEAPDAARRMEQELGLTRDARGNLHGPDGRFVADPEKADRYIDRAQLGEATTPELSSAGREAVDKLIADRNVAKDAREAADSEIRALEETYDIDLSGLTSNSGQADALAELGEKGASDDDGDVAVRASGAYLRSAASLSRASERAGMVAGEDVLKQDGFRQIVGSSDAPGRPGEADLIGVGPEGTSIEVIEAKGGAGGLGSGRYLHDHDPPGRAEQGSAAYLQEILRRDTRFQEVLKLEENLRLRQAYEDGTLEVNYVFVHAHPNGSVTRRTLHLGES